MQFPNRYNLGHIRKGYFCKSNLGTDLKEMHQVG